MSIRLPNVTDVLHNQPIPESKSKSKSVVQFTGRCSAADLFYNGEEACIAVHNINGSSHDHIFVHSTRTMMDMFKTVFNRMQDYADITDDHLDQLEARLDKNPDDEALCLKIEKLQAVESKRVMTIDVDVYGNMAFNCHPDPFHSGELAEILSAFPENMTDQYRYVNSERITIKLLCGTDLHSMSGSQ
jgi:hypothetical protein